MSEINFEGFLETNVSSHNITVRNYLNEHPKLLVIFLRHFGCTYCRKTLQRVQSALKDSGNGNCVPLFIHMSSIKEGTRMLSKFGLDGKPHISDPDQKLYETFGIKRGSFWQHFGPQVLLKGLLDVPRFGIGTLKGDGFQMPGLFLVDKTGVSKAYYYSSVSDEINFKDFIKGQMI